MSDASQRDRQEFGTDLSEVRHEPVASPLRLRLYVAALVLLPFAMIAFTLWWFTTDSYLRHVPYPYIIDTGYGSELRGANCDVVVDGDSTALVGVLPSVIEQRTGLKTCNIAEVAGIKLVNGMMVLNDYLAHNRRPRYLVFVFAPENLTPPEEWTSVSNFEGWFYRIRFHRDKAFWHMALHDPEDVLMDAELGFRDGIQWLPRKPLPPQLANQRELSGGHVSEPGVPLQRCAGDAIERAPDKAWLSHLRTTYGVGGTKVLIDVMPMPSCDEGLPFYRARLGPGVTDNAVETLPIQDYTGSGRLHTDAAGTEALSQRLAEQIADVMKQDGGAANGQTANGQTTAATRGGR